MKFESRMHETIIEYRRTVWGEKPSLILLAMVLSALLLFSLVSMPLGRILADPVVEASVTSAVPIDLIYPEDLINSSFEKQPMMQDTGSSFIMNEGQLHEDVRYYTETFAGSVYVTDEGLTYDLQTEESTTAIAIKESFVSANPLQPNGYDQSQAVMNYFVGEESNWKSNIPSFNKVSFGQVWEGVNVDLKANNNNVEKVFTVAPGADVQDIQLAFEGITGLSVNGEGELVLATELGTVSLTKPLAYQEIGMTGSAVEVSYAVIDSDKYGFTVGDGYDPNYPLIIDPLLASTYIGGADNEGNSLLTPLADDEDMGIAFDSFGNVFIAGLTSGFAHDYPTTVGPYGSPSTDNSPDVVISKFNSDLTLLLASARIGGSDFDEALDIVVNPNNDDIFITGRTNSTDFPTTVSGADNTYNGGTSDIFVSRLPNNLSSLDGSTFIGGSNTEQGRGIAISGTGFVYVVGNSLSPNYPTTSGAYDDTSDLTGGPDVVVTRLDLTLGTITRSTWLGGSNDSVGKDIVIQSGTGDVFITGFTLATNFPITSGAYQMTKSSHNQHDTFIARFDSDLSNLSRSTFLGAGAAGGEHTTPFGIEFDPSGNVVVAGYTASDGFPTTAGAYDTTREVAADDAYISRLSPDLQTLQRSTVIGGASTERIRGLAVTGSGDVYVIASGGSYPTTPGAYNEGANGRFVSKFNNDLSTLIASTSIGGSNTAVLNAIGISSGDVYVAGWTRATNFPTTPGAYDTTKAGAPGTFDFTVSKFTADLSASPPSAGGTIAFTSFRDGNSEIYVMEPDGTGQTRLTNNAFLDQHPSISPDGSKIIFETNRDGDFEIYVMNSDGSGQTNLSNDPDFDAFASWSPDGTQIAFTSDRDDVPLDMMVTQEIYVMDADGSPQTRLTTSGFISAHPSWSPDGTQIAFDSTRDGNLEIYVMDADGSPQTRLTNDPDSDAFTDWSPDGTQIAFASDRDGDFEIFRMFENGTGQTQLTFNIGVDLEPSWSPDGSLIAYQFVSGVNYQINVMTPGGGSQTTLTPGIPEDDIEPDFGPDLVPPPVAPAAISLESVSTITPKFDVDEVIASGLVINDLPGDYVEVSWGDGEVTQFTPIAGAWGPVSHIYGSDAIGSNTLQPFLLGSDEGVKAEGSFAFVTVQPHSTFVVLNALNNPATDSPVTASGTVFDADTGTQVALVPGVSVTFSGNGAAGLPTVLTGGITILDPTDITVVSCSTCIPDNEGATTNNVMHLHPNAEIDFPPGTSVGTLTIQDMGSSQFTVEVTPESPGAPFLTTSFGAAPDAVNFFISAPEGVDKIRIVSIDSGTATTVGISKISTANPGDNIPSRLNIDFESMSPGSYGVFVELETGSFFATANALSSGATGLDITADVVGNSVYSTSSSNTQLYDAVDRTWGAGEPPPANVNADSNTGINTVLCAADTDKDGICASWESSGSVPYAGGSYNFASFEPAAGDSNKDLYVEIDYMTDHQPIANAITRVKNSFAAQGITLHVNVNDPLTHVLNLEVWKDPAGSPDVALDDYEDFKQSFFGTSSERGGLFLANNPSVRDGKGQIYHYGIFGHQIGASCGAAGLPSGLAETPGNDFIVTLGCGFAETNGAHSGTEGSENEQAGTLMHELGHNLNLDHGGPREYRALPSGWTAPATGSQVESAPTPASGTSRTFTITGVSVIAPAGSLNTQGTMLLTETLTFGSDPGTTSATVSRTGAGSGLSFPSAATVQVTGSGTTRQLTVTIPFNINTASATTAATGNLGTYTVSLTITNSAATLSTPTNPAYSPLEKIKISSADYGMNCKPNYPSVMKYTGQLGNFYGALPFVPNFSSQILTTLSESSLPDEDTSSLGAAAGTIIIHAYNPATPSPYRTDQTPNVSWNGDADFADNAGAAVNVNNFGIDGCNSAVVDTSMKGYNDWLNVQLNFKEGISAVDGIYPDPHQQLELTSVIQEQIEEQIDANTANTTATPPGGFYTFPLPVELESDEPATIYYTIDGTDPATSGTVMSGPSPVMLTLTGETVLRFFSVSDATQGIESQKQETYNNVWTLLGFYQPVDMPPTFNSVKGGAVVPLKFEVFDGATELTDTAVVDKVTQQKIACSGSAPQDVIEETVSPGGTVLTYSGGMFQYNWKTPKSPGQCYEVTLSTDDGSTLKAKFELK